MMISVDCDKLYVYNIISRTIIRITIRDYKRYTKKHYGEIEIHYALNKNVKLFSLYSKNYSIILQKGRTKATQKLKQNYNGQLLPQCVSYYVKCKWSKYTNKRLRLAQ